MTLNEFLGSCEPFLALSDEGREVVAACSVRRNLADKEVLFREGAPSDKLYLVTEGVLRLDLNHASGSKFMLTPLTAGMMTDGEISSNSVHPVGATAMNDTVVYLTPRSTVKTLMQRNPAFLESFLYMRDTSLRHITRAMSNAVSLQAEIRLARIMLTFYKIFAEEGKPSLGYNLSHAELSETIACSRQSTAKIMGQWEKRGIISTRYRTIEVLDAEALCDVAQWNHGRWCAGNSKEGSWYSRLR